MTREFLTMCSYQPTVALVIDDPDFGLLRASPSESSGAWIWEALDRVETATSKVDLSFEAGPEGPDNSHRRQLNALVAEIGPLLGRAAPIIAAGLPGSAVMSPDFEWQGAHLTGRTGAFELHFSSIAWPDSLIAVHFQDSMPVTVEIGD